MRLKTSFQVTASSPKPVPYCSVPAEPHALSILPTINQPAASSPSSPTPIGEQDIEMPVFEIMTQSPTILNSANEPDISDQTRDDFERLDEVVRRGLETFASVGLALAEIRDRELWRVGKFSSWAAYCKSAVGLSKTHSNRLIKSAEIYSHLQQVTPIGVTPRCESQVRPICRLHSPDQQALVWSRAVELANGDQPSAKQISDIVAELLAEEDKPTKSKPNYKTRLADALDCLRRAIHTKRTQEEIDLHLGELEAILKLM